MPYKSALSYHAKPQAVETFIGGNAVANTDQATSSAQIKKANKESLRITGI